MKLKALFISLFLSANLALVNSSIAHPSFEAGIQNPAKYNQLSVTYDFPITANASKEIGRYYYNNLYLIDYHAYGVNYSMNINRVYRNFNWGIGLELGASFFNATIQTRDYGSYKDYYKFEKISGTELYAGIPLNTVYNFNQDLALFMKLTPIYSYENHSGSYRSTVKTKTGIGISYKKVTLEAGSIVNKRGYAKNQSYYISLGLFL